MATGGTNVSGTTEASFKAAAERISKATQRLVNRGIPNGLRLIAEEIKTDVQASRPGEGVPRDTGALAGSARVVQISPLVVEISFGSAAAPYALYVHEIMRYHHPLGEARYLVRGIERWKPGGSAAMDALHTNIETALALKK